MKKNINAIFFVTFLTLTGCATIYKPLGNVNQLTDNTIINYLVPVYYKGEEPPEGYTPLIKRYPHPTIPGVEAIDFIDNPDWWTKAYVIGSKNGKVIWSATYPQYGASVEKMEWQKEKDGDYLLYVKTITHMGTQTQNLLELKGKELKLIKRW